MSFDMDAYVKATKAQWESEIKDANRILLWEKGSLPFFVENSEQREPSIIPHMVQDNRQRAAVIVCAGGSYGWKEPLEAFTHAKWLNEIGLHAFILDYRVTPYTTTHSLLDLQRAIRFLRFNAENFNILQDKIAVMGFSSGGHLSAMASEQFDYGNAEAIDPIEQFSCRPDAQILCYPGITFHKYDVEFLKVVLGSDYTDADVSRTSLHLNVRNDTPPIFLWGTEGDFLFEQWLLFIDAVKKKQVPFSFHIFTGREHSFGRERKHSIWNQWTTLCQLWLTELGFIVNPE